MPLHHELILSNPWRASSLRTDMVLLYAGQLIVAAQYRNAFLRSANAQMVSEVLVCRKNLTVLFLVCTLVLMLPACAQLEQLAIPLAIQAIRMGVTFVSQKRIPEGIRYDFNKKNKKADPIWGNRQLFGNYRPPTETVQAEKDSSKSGNQPVKENEHSAEETAKNTDDNVVKSVHASIVGRATKEETAGEGQSERNAGSSDAEPVQKEHSSAPFIMMNVPDR